MEDASDMSLGRAERAKPNDNVLVSRSARSAAQSVPSSEMNPIEGRYGRPGDERDLGHDAGTTEGAIYRLEQLIHAQADELAQAYDRIHRVTALCDLAEWAANTEFEGARPSVPTDDIRQALAGPAS